MTAECDSLDMSCLPSTKAHKGIMQAAEYVKGKLEENNRLQMAFQKAQVGHYTVRHVLEENNRLQMAFQKAQVGHYTVRHVLEENNRLQMAFQKAQVGHYTVRHVLEENNRLQMAFQKAQVGHYTVHIKASCRQPSMSKANCRKITGYRWPFRRHIIL